MCRVGLPDVRSVTRPTRSPDTEWVLKSNGRFVSEVVEVESARGTLSCRTSFLGPVEEVEHRSGGTDLSPVSLDSSRVADSAPEGPVTSDPGVVSTRSSFRQGSDSKRNPLLVSLGRVGRESVSVRGPY